MANGKITEEDLPVLLTAEYNHRAAESNERLNYSKMVEDFNTLSSFYFQPQFASHYDYVIEEGIHTIELSVDQKSSLRQTLSNAAYDLSRKETIPANNLPLEIKAYRFIDYLERNNLFWKEKHKIDFERLKVSLDALRENQFIPSKLHLMELEENHIELN